jgi:hypothetical protein
LLLRIPAGFCIFAILKKRIAIGMMILLLFAQTPMQQLLKIPKLYTHYAEHKGNDADMSFSKFLFMHYYGTDKNDKDADQDAQLPFKSNDLHFIGSMFTCIAPVQIELKHHLPEIGNSFAEYTIDICNPLHSDIFQPPRKA